MTSVMQCNQTLPPSPALEAKPISQKYSQKRTGTRNVSSLSRMYSGVIQQQGYPNWCQLQSVL
eukprot:7725208-Ditylum_brightwellii.AAC.1